MDTQIAPAAPLAPPSDPPPDHRRVLPVTEADFRSWLHPKESSTAPMAFLGVGVVGLFVLVLVIATLGIGLLVIGIVAATLWFTGRIAEARLTGNAILVGEHHFGEIAARIDELRAALDYPHDVRAFVVQDGEINAFLWKVFGRRYLHLNSGLVASMSDAELTFVIGRFIGALRARHLRFHQASELIGGLEKLWVLNLLILPYLRATVLSGDRVGYRLAGDVEASRTALDKLLIGKELAPAVQIDGMLAQGRTLDRSPFKFLSVMFSSHPPMTDRYRELSSYDGEVSGGRRVG